MQLSKEYEVCSITDKEFLIPVGSAVQNMPVLLDLNEISSYILKRLSEQEYSKEELIEAIFQEYDADKETIQRDLEEFLHKGFEIGFINP